MEEYKHEHGSHSLLRWALGILILIIVFWMGVQVGEFKTTLGYYGFGMGPGMMGNNYYGASPYGYAPMMGGYYYGGQTVVPSQATATTTANYSYGPGGMMRGYYQNAPQATSAK